MIKLRTFAAAASMTVAAFGFSGAAHACDTSGFIACALEDAGVVDGNTARALDGANAAAGHIVEQGAAALMNNYYPGSGDLYLNYAPGMQNGRGSRGAPPPTGYPQQNYQQPQGYPQQGNRSTRSPQSNYGQGNYNPGGFGQSVTFQCNTPAGPMIVNSPMTPGAPCWVQNQMGYFTGVAGF